MAHKIIFPRITRVDKDCEISYSAVGTKVDRRNWHTTLEGSDGEWAVTIHEMGMQSGMTSISLVFCWIDNPLGIRTKLVKFGEEQAAIDEMWLEILTAAVHYGLTVEVK